MSEETPQRTYWKLIAGAAAGVCLLLALAAVFKLNQMLDAAKPRIVTGIQSALPGRPLKIGRISLSWPIAVTVSDFEVSNPQGFEGGTFFKADRIKVQPRVLVLLKMLPHLMRRKSIETLLDKGNAASIGTVQFVNPSLFLERKAGEWNAAAKNNKGGSLFIPVKLDIVNGSLSVKDDLKKFDGMGLKDLNGNLNLNPSAPKIDLELTGLNGERVKAYGTTSGSGDFELNIEAENFSALEYARGLVPASEKFFIKEERANAQGSIFLKLPVDFKDYRNWQWRGTAKINDHRANVSYSSLNISVAGSADLEFDPDKIHFKNAEYRTQNSLLKGEGIFQSPWQDPKLQAKIVGHIDSQEAAALFPPHLLPQGRVQISLGGEGPIRQARYSGTLQSSEMKLGGRPFIFASSGAISPSVLDIQSFSCSWGESTATAKGIFSKQSWDAQLDVKNLPLEYFHSRGSAQLGGKSSFAIRVRGTGDDPAITGRVSAQQLVLFNNKLGHLSGRLKARGSSLFFNMATEDSANRILMEVERNMEAVRLKDFSVQLQNGQKMSVRGALQKDTRAISGDLSVASLDFSSLGTLPKFLSSFDGKIFMNGKFSGTWENPLLAGTLRANNIYFKDREIQKEPVDNFSSKFTWEKSKMILTGFGLGSSYGGKIIVTQKPQKGFTVEANAKEANPKILFTILSLNPDVSGALSGSVRLTHARQDGERPRPHVLSGRGNLKINQGHWSKSLFDSFSCQFLLEGDHLKVTELRMQQSAGGFLDLKAEAAQSEIRNPIAVKGVLTNFLVGKNQMHGPVQLDGHLNLEEKPWLSGQLSSDDFRLNKIILGKLRADAIWREKTLNFEKLAVGKFIEGKLKVTMGALNMESPALDGQWHSEPQAVQDWFHLLQLSTPPVQGKMSLSGSIGGSLKNPEYDLAPQFQDLKIVFARSRDVESRLEGFQGSGRAIFKDNLLKSLSIALTRNQNEKLTVLGQANLLTRTLNLQTSIHQIDSKILFYPMGLKRFEGPMDGTLSIDGDWNSPVIKGDVRGKGGKLGAVEMESWDVAGTFKEKEFAFTRLNARGLKGAWRFSVLEDSWIRPQAESKNGIYRLNTDFANISVGPVFLVGSGILEGNWHMQAGTGEPIFTAFARINECTANGFELKPSKLTLQYTDNKLRFLPREMSETPKTPKSPEPNVTGTLDFTKLPCILFDKFSVSDGERRIFFMDGELCKEQPSFLMEGVGVDASILSGIFGSPIPLSGQSHFKIEGKKSRSQILMEGYISLANGKVFEIPLESLDSKFLWKEGVFHLSSFEAKSKRYFDLSAEGKFPLRLGNAKSADNKIDVSLKCSNGNLAFLNLLESDLVKNAGGPFSSQMTIKGTSQSPILNGWLKINEGQAGSKYLGRSLEKADIAVRIKSNKISIQKAEAQSGNQKVQLEGEAALAFDAGEMLFDRFDLKLRTLGGAGIPIQIPEIPAVRERLGLPSTPSRGDVGFSLSVQGRGDRPKIGGEVVLNDVLFSYPPPKKARERSYWFDGAEWDVTLKSGKRTIFQNDVAYAKLEGQLKFSGAKDDLVIRGRLASNDGNIIFLGAKFNLIQASLEVQPPAKYTLSQTTIAVSESRNTAYLSLKAEQRKQVMINGQEVQDVITMQIDRTPLSEKFDSKSITFRSSARPNLDSERVISSAAGFETDFQNLTPEQKDNQLRSGMARILDTQLASPLARSIIQKMGIADRIEITHDDEYTKEGRKSRSSEVRGDTTSSLDPLIGQTFLIEKTFASRLGVGYRATFDKIQDRADFIHQLQLRYPFYKGIYFIGSTELDSEENLGRRRERYGGIETRVRWDFSDLFKWARKKETPDSD